MKKNPSIHTAFVALTLAALLSGCQDWKFPWEKPGTTPWQDKGAGTQTTVPWKGQAVAADTFIKIAQVADLGVVNIGTTQIIKRGSNKKNFKGSPFEDFFGDDLFRHFFGEGPPQEEESDIKRPSLGSGFIISEDGLIVTNNHVIEKASEITVTIGKDHEYKAKVVGTDPKSDVALIKIVPKEKLHPLLLGDSDSLQVGEIVVAIGNPFGLSHTVTQGIVSAKERSIGAGLYDNFLQTDASINPGNSGGPLLNLEAKVIGINTAIVASGQGIGFAIPINTAKDIVKQLQEKGMVTRGWLGVYIQPIDPDLARSLGLPEKKGALVAGVQKGSPAEKAGFKQGDVILAVENKEIRDSNELPIFVSNLAVGKKVSVSIVRNGKKMKLSPIIGELKNSEEEEMSRLQKYNAEPNEERSSDKFGLIVQEQRGEQKGVRIISVSSTSPVAEKGVQRGDIIMEINRVEITNLESYDKILKSLKKGDAVMLLVENPELGSKFIAFTLP